MHFARDIREMKVEPGIAIGQLLVVEAQDVQGGGVGRVLPAEEYKTMDSSLPKPLLGCAILLTGDAHLRGLDFQRASLELKAFDVMMPVIATPREIAAKFF